MKPRIKTILFLLLTVYIIPGIFLLILDREMLWYYLLTSSSTAIPYYFWAAGRKRTCKLFGMEFRF
jgi:hypothetical protein